MQPANLSLDPMASLWSSGGSPSNNNFFSQSNVSASPPDQSAGTSSSAQSRQNDSTFGISSTFYASPQQNPNQGPGQTSKQSQGQDGGAGDTFMGAGTPGPGGVGLGGWKWTVMDGSK